LRKRAARRSETFAKAASSKLRAANVIRSVPTLALDVLLTPRIASMVLLLACLGAMAYFSLDDRFYVYTPVVAGNQYVQTGDILEASELEGWHVAWVQPERAARLVLERLPSLRSAEVTCELPDSCTITVVERQPLFVWRQGGVWGWVDADGILFTGARPTVDVPIVDLPPGSLPLPGKPVSPTVVSGVQSLTQALPGLTMVRYTNERGFEVLDPTFECPVYLGKGPNLEPQVAVWRALSTNLAQRGIWPAFIDARYANAPYYAMR
jgi:cell division septal protein FtsQ